MTSTKRWASGGKWFDLATGEEVVPGGGTPVDPSTFFVTVEVGGNDVRKTGGSGPGSFDQEDLYNTTVARLDQQRPNRTTPGLGGRMKFFDGGGGIGKAASQLAAVKGWSGPQPVLCFKQFTVTDLNNRMNVITKPEVWVYDQEYYGGADTGAWDNYNQKHQQIHGTVAAHPQGGLVKVLMVSSNAQERKNPGYFASANGAYTDGWGADAYNAKTGSAYTAAQLFSAQFAAWETMKGQNPNLKWIVSEYGLSRHKTTSPEVLYTGAERLAYFQSHIDYLIAHGASGITYWTTDNRNEGSILHDYSFDKDTPQDKAFSAGVADLLDLHPVPTGGL